MEKINEDRLDSLHNQLAMISSLLVPTAQTLAKQQTEAPQASPSLLTIPPRKEKFQVQCEICRQNFETERAKESHEIATPAMTIRSFITRKSFTSQKYCMIHYWKIIIVVV